MKKMLWHILFLCLFLAVTPPAAAKTILYVPADDRPVSLQSAADTVTAAQYDILVPPKEFLAGRSREGEPEQLWEWVFANAKQADALVLSADSLIYGGLVDSRVHDFSSIVLEWRLKRFNQLKKICPQTPLYTFSTVMRSPKASGSPVEPAYYGQYGSAIFQVTSLQDKAETAGLTEAEQRELRTAAASLPADILADWMSRRAKNYQINTQLIGLTRTGVIDYFIAGRDDTAVFSQSHKEGRMLKQFAQDLSVDKFASFPGADQLGMVLLARAYNTLSNAKPVIVVHYALGTAGSTIPRYEDQPFGQTVAEHIIAAGGIVGTDNQHSDLLLAINTPLSAVTEEAELLDNIPAVLSSTRQFVATIKSTIASSVPVAVADIAFANGADNALMIELSNNHLLTSLSAYSGWNTASNTLGYAIGQGLMAKSTNYKDRLNLLAVRYLDDWAYQANIRKEIYREQSDLRDDNVRYLDRPNAELEALVQKKLRNFAGKQLWLNPAAVEVTFPWNRLFEIEVTFVAPETKAP
ncbi:DUF4127 family protein [Anaerospora hongkongensis]|uniref:DUF4127 family protein n=1 Tax=Anaerospora hongkongensis TaxID=244830 RepID=UPI002897F36C|nr:DUF4127 family protein [Anaerospora hongkongensis]